jgi:hypothetical protein
VWQPLPEGWREAFDPVTNQPYYYNPITHEKTWARPQQGRTSPNAADTITVTPVVPMQQPRSLQPSRKRNGSAPGGAAGGARGGEGGAAGATSCASAPQAHLQRNGSGGEGESEKPPPQVVTNGEGAALSDTL